MSAKWHFSASSKFEGFNDAGIETFAGERMASLAREVIQNSLDAAEDPKKMNKVTVEFDMVNIPTGEFFEIDGLKSAIGGCKAERLADDKAQRFLSKAEEVLEKNSIPCLRITDFGTTGLEGAVDDQLGQWFAIMYGTGIGAKGGNEAAGGSFGIGKHAPFALSDLRTVFYSTHYRGSERAQGKTILMSRTTEGGDFQSATGFYGLGSRIPLEGVEYPSWLKRAGTPSEYGTQITYSGFFRA